MENKKTTLETAFKIKFDYEKAEEMAKQEFEIATQGSKEEEIAELRKAIYYDFIYNIDKIISQLI